MNRLTPSETRIFKSVRSDIDGASSLIANILDSARDRYGKMTSKAQGTDKGSELSEQIEHLEQLHTALESVEEALGNFSID